MKLEDYLPLYYGGTVYYPKSKRVVRLDWSHLMIKDEDRDWKLAVRQLEDLTEEEMANLVRQRFGYDEYLDFWVDENAVKFKGRNNGGYKIRCEQSLNSLTPEQVKWLLQQEVDVFGLIPKGLAVDKKEVLDDVATVHVLPEAKPTEAPKEEAWKDGDAVSVMRQTGRDKEPRLVTGTIEELNSGIFIEGSPAALIKYDDGYPSYYHKISTLKP